MMKSELALILCLLFAGCPNTHQVATNTIDGKLVRVVLVNDGNCEPIEGATIYHQEKDILLYMPWGPFYTDNEGVAVIRVSAVGISINREGYKPAFIEEPASQSIEVFLYAESEEYESGLIDFKKCKGNK